MLLEPRCVGDVLGLLSQCALLFVPLAFPVVLQYRLGLFDDQSSQPYWNIPTSVVCSQEHTELALSAAHQGIVLLKNNGTLPLAASSIKNLAVIGPNGACTHTHSSMPNRMTTLLMKGGGGAIILVLV